MDNLLLFGKWDMSEVEVNDISIKKYINIEPVLIPHTSGRHNKKMFGKSDISIVERLINRMMRSEDNTGKKQLAYRIVDDTLDIINTRAKKNPVQVLVDAIKYAGPREEVVRLKYGGIAVPKSVDTAPQRRVDSALRLICEGAEKSAFKSRRPIADCLASEILAASNVDVKCYSINRKQGLERVARAAR